jgi:predicted nucleotidyltransferase
MIRTDDWQTQAIKELQTLLTQNDKVIAFAVFGSVLHPHEKLDTWSDLDCLLVVNEEAYSQFYPAKGWLEPFGELYTQQQSETMFYGTLRACFVDFRRLDILVTIPSNLIQLTAWPRVPFWEGLHLVFSRSDPITQFLSQAFPATEPTFPSPSQFDEMVNHFWFKAMLAGYKIIRDDRLIALHLALDLVRDCCVIGMMLRDRSGGTNIHREGGEGNNVVENLQDACSSYTSTGILDIIEQSAIQFDQLTAQWSRAYDEKRYPLLEWLGQIRRTISMGK